MVKDAGLRATEDAIRLGVAHMPRVAGEVDPRVERQDTTRDIRSAEIRHAIDNLRQLICFVKTKLLACKLF
jgi:hypothetical protein